MNILLDLCVVLIAVLCIVFAVRKGFVKTLIEFLFNIGGFLIVIFAAKPLSAFLNLHFVSPNLQKMAADSIGKLLGAGGEGLSKLLSDLPEPFQKLLEGFQFSAGELAKHITGLENLQEAGEKAIEAMVSPAANAISYALAIGLGFLLVILLSKLLTFLVDLVFSLPVLHGLNKGAGLLLGIVQAAFFIIVLANVVRIVLPYSGNFGIFAITQEAVDKSVLFSLFYKVNLVDFFMK